MFSSWTHSLLTMMDSAGSASLVLPSTAHASCLTGLASSVPDLLLPLVETPRFWHLQYPEVSMTTEATPTPMASPSLSSQPATGCKSHLISISASFLWSQHPSSTLPSSTLNLLCGSIGLPGPQLLLADPEEIPARGFYLSDVTSCSSQPTFEPWLASIY